MFSKAWLAVAQKLTLVLALLSACPAIADKRAEWFDQRQVGPFVFRATFDLTPHEATLAELTELERELRRVLALRPCRAPISVLLFRDKSEHETYLSKRFPGVPYRRALFVRQDGRATVFAYQHKELAVDLRHECTHALLHADLAMVPLWLDEGLAEYFEMPASERASGNPHQAALRWNLRLGFVCDIASLEEKQGLAELTSRDYQFAWAWTHFLLHGPEAATQELWAYLGAIRRGEPPGLMSARIDRVAPDAKSSLVQHFRRWPRRVAEAKNQRRLSANDEIATR